MADDFPPPPPVTRRIPWRVNVANVIIGATLNMYLKLQDILTKWAFPDAGHIPMAAQDSAAADAIAAEDPTVLPAPDDILQPEIKQ